MPNDSQAQLMRAEWNELPMRVGVGQLRKPDPEYLRFLKQIGVNDVIFNFYEYDYEDATADDHPLTGTKEFSYEGLLELRERVADAGLRLHAIENVPKSFYDKVMLGKEGREEQIEHMKNTLRNMADAGIPIFGYHFNPGTVYSTGRSPVRGGASGRQFHLDAVENGLILDREYTEAELWENYEYFVTELLPVAEENGLKMCLHPNDPPVEELRGLPQLFRDFDSFKRAMDIEPSEYHGLEFCLGCWSEMGEDLDEVIRYFGGRDELFYIHFRDVIGTVPAFTETFVDDPEGNFDTYEILELLFEVGFEGVIIPDHVPQIVEETDGRNGRSLTVGYLNGMIESIRRQRLH
ncbi:mannonate dehydratase [Halocatena marina]|uniref:mannonate dehydratase n=1 Tax=Halocatena marina TaxID=2934937 RepID=A0ABD5YXY0_9EURY|nr:mannonate dehydratase [Halocatena marina]